MTLYDSFQTLPGVGKSIAQDLIDMKITSLDDLKMRDPDELYADIEKLKGMHVDRCVLYVFRCIVYALNNPDGNRELFKWWNWKDPKNAKK